MHVKVAVLFGSVNLSITRSVCVISHCCSLVAVPPGGSPSDPEVESLWKQHSFLVRNSSMATINRSLLFREFVQALMLVALKKYGNTLKQKDSGRTLTYPTPRPPPLKASSASIGGDGGSSTAESVLRGMCDGDDDDDGGGGDDDCGCGAASEFDDDDNTGDGRLRALRRALQQISEHAPVPQQYLTPGIAMRLLLVRNWGEGASTLGHLRVAQYPFSTSSCRRQLTACAV